MKCICGNEFNLGRKKKEADNATGLFNIFVALNFTIDFLFALLFSFRILYGSA